MATPDKPRRQWGMAMMLCLLLAATGYGLHRQFSKWQSQAVLLERQGTVLGHVQRGGFHYAEFELAATAQWPEARATLTNPGLRQLPGSVQRVLQDPAQPDQVHEPQPWTVVWLAFFAVSVLVLGLAVCGVLLPQARLQQWTLCLIFVLSAGVIWVYVGQQTLHSAGLFLRGVETTASVLGSEPQPQDQEARVRPDPDTVVLFLASAANPPRLVQIATPTWRRGPAPGDRVRLRYLAADPGQTLMIRGSVWILWLVPMVLSVFALMLTASAWLFAPRRAAT